MQTISFKLGLVRARSALIFSRRDWISSNLHKTLPESLLEGWHLPLLHYPLKMEVEAEI